MIYTIYLQEMSKHLCECMRVCRFVWGCINMWLKRGRKKGLESRVKVWSKDESYDYIRINRFFFFLAHIIPLYIYLDSTQIYLTFTYHYSLTIFEVYLRLILTFVCRLAIIFIMK